MITILYVLGGSGIRFGNATPKQFHLLGEKKVYQHALGVFETHPKIKEIILVIPEGWDDAIFEAHRKVIGGNTRQQSVYRGLQACKPQTEYVMIHDAVRPFLSRDIVDAHIEALQRSDAVNTCIPSKDTVNQIASDEIVAIPDRSLYVRGQTPQSFSYPLICKAHEATKKTHATDDCQLVLDLGYPVSFVQGDEKNFKITTPLDLDIAKTFYYTSHKQ